MSNNKNNMKNKCGFCRTEFAKELNQQNLKQSRETDSHVEQKALENFEGLKDR